MLLFTLSGIILALLTYFQGQGVHYLSGQPSELPLFPDQDHRLYLNSLLFSPVLCSRL